MQFRTQVPIPTFDYPIDYNSRIFSIGSCFAVNIAKKFDYFKFQSTVNPFGILFHPAALEKFISFAVDKMEFSDADVFFHNDRWHCFDAHSEISNPDKMLLLDELNSKRTDTTFAITNASHCVITLGTAWVYRNRETGAIVANCHKIPQKHFKKELLSVSEIISSIQNIAKMLREGNPSLQIIFTVSPVRHIKDGFVENQRSKSNLISALHDVLQNTQNAVYFPSYEIMIDELRDYRFYSDDMLHPSQVAVDYIWERVSETFISSDSIATIQEVDAIQKGLSHRPFTPDSAQHQQFLSTLDRKISSLQTRFPHIDF